MHLARRGLTVLTLTILAAGLSVAQEPPKIDPHADRILKIMSDVLAAAEQFTVHNEATTDEIFATGQLVALTASIDVAVRRPDAAHAVLHGDLRPMRYWIGGWKLAVVDEKRWTYAVTQVAADLDGAIDDAWSKYGVKIPLVDFISNNPYEDLTRDVESGVYVGLHGVDGVPCHHLAFTQSDIDWQIWIEDGLLPLPRKLEITYKDEPGAPRYTAMLSDWNLSPDLGDVVFEFTPPDGAEQIEFAVVPAAGSEE